MRRHAARRKHEAGLDGATALTVKRAADGLVGLPQCEDFVTQLSDMAERHANGDRRTQKGFSDDRDRLTLIREELFRRMTEGPG